MAITLRVFGIPKGSPRPRRSKSGGVYVPPQADDWKSCVRAAVRHGFPRPPQLRGPIRLSVQYIVKRPKKGKRKAAPCEPTGAIITIEEIQGDDWVVTKPDLDNIDKATMDALTEAGAWIDDNQVCDKRTAKTYGGASR